MVTGHLPHGSSSALLCPALCIWYQAVIRKVNRFTRLKGTRVPLAEMIAGEPLEQAVIRNFTRSKLAEMIPGKVLVISRHSMYTEQIEHSKLKR